ncbi:HEAT repeat domain-containing protein [Anabaena azotica]|uniref:HEAT repeat domain-containing protein n=1 Tax=Anabaena azotica FACHB-119 TaxID=947527 RepID=A0ABR8DDP5_9NOST|nr:HEAT repeat domain-containing protein [Anabaena azotica]MBD2504731.1 HEAT repeat domain-containing protein [Anabaena azotica FACHB-119]
MSKQEKIVASLIKYVSPLSPFISIEEFEKQRQQWYLQIDADDVDILLNLLVEGPSQTKFDIQDIEEVGIIASEAISAFAHKTGINLLPKILSRLNEFTKLLHIIQLLGRLGNKDALPILVLLYKTKKLSCAETIYLFWSIGQTRSPEAVEVLREMKESLSDNLELKEKIDVVLNEIAQGNL